MTTARDSLALTLGAVAILGTAAHLARRRGVYSAYGSGEQEYDIVGPDGSVIATGVGSDDIGFEVTRHARQHGYRKPELTRFPGLVGMTFKSPQTHRNLRGARNEGSRALSGPFFYIDIERPRHDGTTHGKISDYKWWVTFTEGYARPRRFSVPMVSLGAAEAWEQVYRDDHDSKRWVYLASAPSRDSTVLRPMMSMPDGSRPTDLPRRRRSLRGPR